MADGHHDHSVPDATFSGAHDVTISGYTATPDGSYGSINGTNLTAGPNTISVTFDNGVATANLKLNKAAAQEIGFRVVDVTTPDTNKLTITPCVGSLSVMALTQGRSECGGCLVEGTIIELSLISNEFKEMWNRQEVLYAPDGYKVICHPIEGSMAFEYLAFQAIDSPDLQMVLNIPARESNTAEKVKRLARKSRTDRYRISRDRDAWLPI